MISTTVVVGEVVLSALPARHWTDDTQVYLRMDCKGVTGKKIVAHTLKLPSGRVCMATCIKKKLKKKKKPVDRCIPRRNNLVNSPKVKFKAILIKCY